MQLKRYSIAYYYSFAFLACIIAACNNLPEKDKTGFNDAGRAEEQTNVHATLLPQNQSRYKLGDTLKIKLQPAANYKPDSIHLLLDDLDISAPSLSVAIPTRNTTLGKHIITAVLFVKGRSEHLSSAIYLLADVPAKVYNYNIVNAYPHDTTAFTEGLEYHDGYLYESTGQYGKSELRKVELTTGKVLKKIVLNKEYFGEGVTKFKNNFIQLTWKENTGFVYDLNFNQIKTFDQNNTEGWGLSNNGKYLLMSDGSNKIYFLNPETYREEKHIEVYDDQLPVRTINELEYVNKKIYANIWETNSIVIINPENGQLIGTVNVADILNMYNKPLTIDVLNGIAYDEKNNRLFITGKNWPKVFEIKIISK